MSPSSQLQRSLAVGGTRHLLRVTTPRAQASSLGCGRDWMSWHRTRAAAAMLAATLLLASCADGGEGGPSVDPTRTASNLPSRTASLPSPTGLPTRSDSSAEPEPEPEPSDSAETSEPASQTPTETPSEAPTPSATAEASPTTPPEDTDEEDGRGRGRRALRRLVAPGGPRGRAGDRRPAGPAVASAAGVAVRLRDRPGRGDVVDPRAPARAAQSGVARAGGGWLGRLVRTGRRPRGRPDRARGHGPGRSRPGASARPARRRPGRSCPGRGPGRAGLRRRARRRCWTA